MWTGIEDAQRCQRYPQLKCPLTQTFWAFSAMAYARTSKMHLDILLQNTFAIPINIYVSFRALLFIMRSCIKSLSDVTL
jgi:hypothetical protein